MRTRTCGSGRLVLGLGGNIAGAWGPPEHTIRRAVQELRQMGLRSVRSSHLYRTKPLGPGRQPPFANAVVLAESRLPAFAVLRLVKQIERKAGRRPGRRWGPRPLDIDILDYGGRRLGSPSVKRRGPLVLPHPELHRRAFVLVPLGEVAPSWRHPVTGASVRSLMRRLGWKARREAVQTLDSVACSCEKAPN